jgi:hypothetical protein
VKRPRGPRVVSRADELAQPFNEAELLDRCQSAGWQAQSVGARLPPCQGRGAPDSSGPHRNQTASLGFDSPLSRSALTGLSHTNPCMRIWAAMISFGVSSAVVAVALAEPPGRASKRHADVHD